MTDTTTTTSTENQSTATGNAEAAKYRRRLREVEAERGALRSTLDTARRREVDRITSEHLADTDDAWSIGRWDLDDLVGDDGLVDAGKVTAATTALIESRPRLARDHEIGADFDGGARTSVRPPTTSWSSVLSGDSP